MFVIAKNMSVLCHAQVTEPDRNDILSFYNCKRSSRFMAKFPLANQSEKTIPFINLSFNRTFVNSNFSKKSTIFIFILIILRVWDFEAIDTADATDDSGKFEMDPMNEMTVGKDVQLYSIVKSVDEENEPTIWYVKQEDSYELSFPPGCYDQTLLFQKTKKG